MSGALAGKLAGRDVVATNNATRSLYGYLNVARS